MANNTKTKQQQQKRFCIYRSTLNYYLLKYLERNFFLPIFIMSLTLFSAFSPILYRINEACEKEYLSWRLNYENQYGNLLISCKFFLKNEKRTQVMNGCVST